MIRSMTAFAASDAKAGLMLVSCELRSVNHRYLDISLKLPEPLRFADGDIRALIGAKLNRGKIECSINLRKNIEQNAFTVNQQAVAALVLAAGEIERQLPAALAYSALDVLAFPGIQQESDLDKEELWTVVKQLILQSVEQIVLTREREGQQLKNLIQDRCLKIKELSSQAMERVPVALAVLRAKLLDRINELKAQPDHDRVEQELVFLTQKLDVMEELDRMNTHVNEVLRVLELTEPVGRRLDFLMQELHREANTLGSKSADKELTQISIELKVLIEQIREQVQNIE